MSQRINLFGGKSNSGESSHSSAWIGTDIISGASVDNICQIWSRFGCWKPPKIQILILAPKFQNRILAPKIRIWDWYKIYWWMHPSEIQIRDFSQPRPQVPTDPTSSPCSCGWPIRPEIDYYFNLWRARLDPGIKIHLNRRSEGQSDRGFLLIV